MSTNDNWCLIESDPGVFSELIKGFGKCQMFAKNILGVESLECEEVYDLYETSSVSDAYGFIFLFSYDDKQEDMGKVILDENNKGIFFAKQLFEFDEKAPKSSEDVYHFVGYLPINGTLYELDGLKPGPIDHGRVPENSSWIDTLRPLLMKRMEKCVDGKFNIMAVVPNRLAMYESQLARVKGEPNDVSQPVFIVGLYLKHKKIY
ncbi:unnamed protein product [Trichobilharzia regenti]|nr:unnamed protein product [Trichobilharzia regenti]